MEGLLEEIYVLQLLDVNKSYKMALDVPYADGGGGGGGWGDARC